MKTTKQERHEPAATKKGRGFNTVSNPTPTKKAESKKPKRSNCNESLKLYCNYRKLLCPTAAKPKNKRNNKTCSKFKTCV